MRKNYVFFDIGFYEDCNLKCAYCRKKYIKNTNTLSLFDVVQEVELVKAHYRIAVVKISGYGEITTWRNFGEVLKYLAGEFPSVQIITNGTYTKKTMEEICKYSNVSLNITIDGHTLEMNSYRTEHNESIQRIVLNNFLEAMNAGIPLEINSVLHDKNIKTYESFLEYISSVKGYGQLIVFPFPVKIFERTKMQRPHISWDKYCLHDLVDNWWKIYGDILPSYEYAKDLKSFCANGRQNVCHVNWLNIGTGARDERLVCPNYGESLSMGDFRKSFSYLEKCEKVEKEYFKIQIGADCKTCFNHFHILNLYVEERITLDELLRIPSLNQTESIAIIKKVKEEYDALCDSIM